MGTLDDLLETMRRDNVPTTPCCAKCWYEDDHTSVLDIDDNGNLSCSKCGLVVKAKGDE